MRLPIFHSTLSLVLRTLTKLGNESSGFGKPQGPESASDFGLPEPAWLQQQRLQRFGSLNEDEGHGHLSEPDHSQDCDHHKTHGHYREDEFEDSVSKRLYVSDDELNLPPEGDAPGYGAVDNLALARYQSKEWARRRRNRAQRWSAYVSRHDMPENIIARMENVHHGDTIR